MGPESVVGLCLERGPEMVVAVLAVWLAGAAYLPLDPAYPAERLAFMLADSRASVVVGTAASAGDLPAGRVRVIAVDDPVVRAQVAAAAPAPAVPAVPGQLAYVMYTSGSTGAPKGVQVTHGGVVNLAVALRPVLGAGPGARVLQFASFSFDAVGAGAGGGAGGGRDAGDGGPAAAGRSGGAGRAGPGGGGRGGDVAAVAAVGAAAGGAGRAGDAGGGGGAA